MLTGETFILVIIIIVIITIVIITIIITIITIIITLVIADLPELFNGSQETENCLGAALQAAYKMVRKPFHYQ